MFPINKRTLPILEIADYWAREIDPPASLRELLGLLEGAWWRGEILGDSQLTRLEFLKRIFKSMRDRSDAGVVFITGEDDEKSSIVELPNGSVKVDVRYRIPLPSSDTNTWDETACNEAFMALAQASSIESYPEITPGLAFIELSYTEFTEWLAERGFREPKFWRPRSVLKKGRRGRPAEYDWHGVQAKLHEYVSLNGPVTSISELLEICANYAMELHPNKRWPDDKTTREAIKTHRLDLAARLAPGK